MPATGTNAVTGNSICTVGQQLDPNQTCDILLQFAPTAAGNLATVLKVYVTGPGEASAGIGNTNNVRNLTGVGLERGQRDPQPESGRLRVGRGGHGHAVGQGGHLDQRHRRADHHHTPVTSA